MATRTATALEQLLDNLEKKATPLDSESLGAVAQEIAKVFHVASDEIAVMELSRSGKVLRFVLPEKLRAVGTIPLTNTTALAARTARERRADIMNNFTAARHASVFEGVPLGRREGQSIHKIISAPILRGDKVVGVAQISRKGPNLADSGPDFTSKDLSELQGLNNLLGRFLAIGRET